MLNPNRKTGLVLIKFLSLLMFFVLETKPALAQDYDYEDRLQK
jgi:hypothetical protein